MRKHIVFESCTLTEGTVYVPVNYVEGGLKINREFIQETTHCESLFNLKNY